MTQRRAALADEGFTLVEVLAAVAVLGLVLAMLANGLRFGALASRLASGERADDMLAADRAIRYLVERAEPGLFPEPATLSGTAGALRFTTELPSGGGPVARRADVEIGAAGGQLVLRWRPHRHAEAFGPGPAWRDEVLVAGVERVVLAYHGGPASGWSPSWTGEALPSLVRIELVFPAGSGLAWPPMVVAPRREPVEE